jgi:hypothetical protein
MNTLNKTNKMPLSINDLELLKDDLDKLFFQQSGFDLHIDEDKGEVIAYEYLTKRLSGNVMIYCVKQQINARTFTARLSEYRKLPAADSVALVPVVHIKPTKPPSSVPAPATATMVFTHVHGHRLELSSSVPAAWVAELLRCLA